MMANPDVGSIAFAHLTDRRAQGAGVVVCSDAADERGCKTVMNDIEIRSDMSGIVGWAFRVPLRATKHIRCASCGADVPRENWTITDPQ
jgi:hypothetical protein